MQYNLSIYDREKEGVLIRYLRHSLYFVNGFWLLYIPKNLNAGGF